MAQIDNIVQIQITRETTQVDITSFDIPLILVAMSDTDVAFGTDIIRTYTSLEEVADDFPTTHKAYIMASKLLGGATRPHEFKIGKVDRAIGTTQTYVDALQDIIDIDDTWYAVVADSHLDTDILAIAATIQAMRKMYFTSSSAVGIADQSVTDDILSQLSDLTYDRTALIYSPQADTEYPEASWVGSQLPHVPGSNTWEYKPLIGATITNLTATEITTVEAKGGNYYIRVKGVPITRRGKVVGDFWIDEIILIDWIYARMQEQIFFRLANTLKIPYTDAGATMIENEMRQVLSTAVANGGIDTYNVRAPIILSIAQNQRTARILGDFTFEARLAGAVSIVTIKGVVSY